MLSVWRPQAPIWTCPNVAKPSTHSTPASRKTWDWSAPFTPTTPWPRFMTRIDRNPRNPDPHGWTTRVELTADPTTFLETIPTRENYHTTPGQARLPVPPIGRWTQRDFIEFSRSLSAFEGRLLFNL